MVGTFEKKYSLTHISYTLAIRKHALILKLGIAFTRAAPDFDNLAVYCRGCVFNINTVHKTVEKLKFQAFY